MRYDRRNNPARDSREWLRGGVPEVVKVELGSVSIQRVGSKVVSSSFQNPEGQVRPPKTKVSRGHPFSGVKLIG